MATILKHEEVLKLTGERGAEVVPKDETISVQVNMRLFTQRGDGGKSILQIVKSILEENEQEAREITEKDPSDILKHLIFYDPKKRWSLIFYDATFLD